MNKKPPGAGGFLIDKTSIFCYDNFDLYIVFPSPPVKKGGKTMKKHRNRTLFICLLLICFALLLCAGCANSDVESPSEPIDTTVPSNGNDATVPTPKPPGTLLSPEEIPPADLGDIGQTVMFSFPQLLKDSQYDDQDPLNPDAPEVMHIVYLEDANRLAVITEMESNKSLACLTVYEPEWIGSGNLMANLAQEFQAKIVHRVNIDWMEGIIYMGNQIYGDLKEDSFLELDPSRYTGVSQGKCIYGRFYYGQEEIGQAITDEITATFLAYDQSTLTTKNDVFMRIVERFDLSKYLDL